MELTETVMLKDGGEVPSHLLGATMSGLRGLLERQPVAFMELVALCRNRQHELFGNAGDVLREWNMIETSGQPNDTIREIVLVATEGEGPDLRLVSPLHDE